ncbi:hypothetical protein [Burkholderia sp. S-53]|uniref:hypothetical protein n=1 Tax=Burkholderia sp. S-53 TaxID=2906514 RepID=UPI0021CDF312|nr:hypothetical protein [Burkholderia sp. S-53]UXU86377.1 hypothetical protein LXM88_14420 [Burkholderia sp. S-53]
MNDENRLVDEENNQDISTAAAQTTNWPTIATLNGKLYLVNKAQGSTKMQYQTYDGTTWTRPAPVNNIDTTNQAIALAALNNNLYMAHKGSGNDTQVYYNSTNGTQWGNDRGVQNCRSDNPVALAHFKTKLYLGFKQASGTNIYTTTFDGSSWASSPNQVLTGVARTTQAVALAAFGTKLFLAHKGATDSKIFYTSSSDGINWATENIVRPEIVSTNAPVAMAAFNGNLYLAYKGAPDSNNNIYYTWTSDGINWQFPRELLLGVAQTTEPVSLTVFNNTLYLAHQSASDSSIFYTSTADGINWQLEQPIPYASMEEQ